MPLWWWVGFVLASVAVWACAVSALWIVLVLVCEWVADRRARRADGRRESWALVFQPGRRW